MVSAARRLRRAPAAGLIRTLTFEIPWLSVRQVELTPGDRERNIERLSRELTDISADCEVLYRDDRLVPRLEHLEIDSSQHNGTRLEAGQLYVISGGLGGVGALLARRLAAEHDVRLLLVGRSSSQARAEAVASLEGFEDRIGYESVDVCDFDALDAAVARVERRGGATLAGVFHLAGTYHEQLLTEETPAGLEAALRPKLLGGLNLAKLLQHRGGGLFVAFSSLNGSFGGFGVGAYSAGSRSLEALCDHLREVGLNSYCLEWSRWHQVGMSAAITLPKRPPPEYCRSSRPGLTSCLAMLQRPPGHYLIGIDSSRPAIRRLLDRESEPVEILAAYYGETQTPFERVPRRSVRYGSRCELIAIDELPAMRGARSTAIGWFRTGSAPRGALHESRGATSKSGWPRSGAGARSAAARPSRRFFELGGHSLAATQVVARPGRSVRGRVVAHRLVLGQNPGAVCRAIETLHWAAQATGDSSSTALRDEGEV